MICAAVASPTASSEARAPGLFLVLGSSSPRRLALLQQAGLAPARVLTPEVDETPRPRELPRHYALRMAESKAEQLAEALAGERDWYLLTADTVVAVGRRILPKAAAEEEARRCLELLSGRRHRVFGGVCVLRWDGRRSRRVVETRVRFKRLSKDELESYLASGEWRGKAGGYAIQGRAAALIPWINGSYTNVVGLPLVEALTMLEGLGYRRPRPCGR